MTTLSRAWARVRPHLLAALPAWLTVRVLVAVAWVLVRVMAGRLRPGDRIRLPGGTKKVKKVFLESRILPSERHRMPLVVDAEGQVLWIPGVARAEWVGAGELPDALRIGIG